MFVHVQNCHITGPTERDPRYENRAHLKIHRRSNFVVPMSFFTAIFEENTTKNPEFEVVRLISLYKLLKKH